MCRIVKDVGILRFDLVNRNTLEPSIFVGCDRMSENSGVGLHKFHCICKFKYLSIFFFYFILFAENSGHGYYGALHHFQQYFSYIWRSVLLVEETGVLGENHRPVTSNCQTLSNNVVSSIHYHERDSNSLRYLFGCFKIVNS